MDTLFNSKLTEYSEDTIDTAITALEIQDNATTSSNETLAFLAYISVYDSIYLIPEAVLFGIIFLTGFVGNLITCIVIARNKSMHSVTNYYLFNLAVSDITMLVLGLLPDLYTDWELHIYRKVTGGIFCVLTFFIFHIALHATILTVAAVSVERYIAICHPLKSFSTKIFRVMKVLAVIWLVAIAWTIPEIFWICQFCHIENDTIIKAQKKIFKSLGIRGFVIFAVPMILIIVLYIIISVKLQKASKKKNIADQKNTIKMLAAVVIAHLICWLPIRVRFFYQNHYYAMTVEDRYEARHTYNILFHVSRVLFYLANAINPFLYSMMSKKFREALKTTFGLKICSRKSLTGSTKTMSSICMEEQPTNNAVPQNRDEVNTTI